MGTIKLADRVDKLGVETAFLVAGKAAAHAAAGNRVYPFHLGDLNLKTPAQYSPGSLSCPAGRQDRLYSQCRDTAAQGGTGRGF